MSILFYTKIYLLFYKVGLKGSSLKLYTIVPALSAAIKINLLMSSIFIVQGESTS